MCFVLVGFCWFMLTVYICVFVIYTYMYREQLANHPFWYSANRGTKNNNHKDQYRKQLQQHPQTTQTQTSLSLKLSQDTQRSSTPMIQEPIFFTVT